MSDDDSSVDVSDTEERTEAIPAQTKTIDSDEDSDEETTVVKRKRKEAERYMREQQNKDSQRTRFANMSEAQMEEYFRTRHEIDSGPIKAENEEFFDSITQNGLLPDAKSPNLYIVRCRMGDEQNLCIQLMKKYMASQRTDEPLEIKSVVVKSGIKGIIYIEAFKTPHVLKAVEGISAIMAHQIKMVPKKEMVDTLKVVRDIPTLKINSYVRVKRAMFKDDLAQVDDIDRGGNEVMLKLVPRIDYTRLRGPLRGQEEERGITRRKGRPPPGLFNSDKIRAIGGDFTKDGDFYIFEGNRYRNGFLYKYFKMDQIVVDGVKPAVSELELFNEGSNEFKGELSVGKDFAKFHNFAPGDNVEVTEGELLNLQGRITNIEGDIAYIKPNHSELKDIVTVNLREIRKSFKIGDHVLVIDGHFKGDTGIIVRVEENLIILISDINNEEVKVLPRDLKLSPHVATGVDSLGRFQLHDLVQVDKDLFGVIVGVHAEVITVLNQQGNVMNLKSSQIMKKIDAKFARGTDANKHQIQKGDHVKLLDDTNRDAEILHLNRGAVFLSCRAHKENGGVLVRPARQIALVGAKTDALSSTQNSNDFKIPQSPRHFLQSPARNSSAESSIGAGSHGGQTPMYGEKKNGGPGRFTGSGALYTKRDTSLIGKHVRIKSGAMKAAYGIVKDATDTTAMVELHSSCKTIQVVRTNLEVVEGDAGAGSGGYRGLARTPTAGSRTPAYSGFQTPMYGSQTPMHDTFGSRTPHYGNQTPAYDGSRTPSHSGAWDPSGLATPAHNSFGHDDDDDRFDNNYVVPTPAPAQIEDSSRDYRAPMSVDPFHQYEPQTPRTEFGDYDAPDISSDEMSRGQWIEVDMKVATLHGSSSANDHGRRLTVVRVDKRGGQVVCRTDNGRETRVPFNAVVPITPTRDDVGEYCSVIYDSHRGMIEPKKSERLDHIDGDYGILGNGARVLLKYCVLTE
ncbi:hypothetical protein FO519_007402 [Halicephalobus sp. NKZ332]|nr:hypothetical protein FO519_007402 [Halicephalobus sp. NKZ332]